MIFIKTQTNKFTEPNQTSKALLENIYSKFHEDISSRHFFVHIEILAGAVTLR